MGAYEDRLARAEYVCMLIRQAVERGHGEEALRLADKYRVPNIERGGLGVELSNDPALKKIPKAR